MHFWGYMRVENKFNLSLIVILLSVLIVSCANQISNKNTQSNQGYIQVQGGKIFYKSMGQGTPILVVHGGPGLDQTYLQPQLFEFAENHQLIFYDQRGSGKSLESTDNSSNINIEQFIADIEELRTKLGLKKIILMGHSWGGLLSMHYATKYSKNLHGLILLNTAPANHKGQKAFVDSFMERTANIKKDITPLFSYKEFEKQNANEIADLYRKVFSVYFYNQSDVKSLNLTFNVNSAKSGFKVNEKMSKTAWLETGINLLPQLKTLKVPTLILHGKQDVVPLWTAKEINSVIKGSKMITLENCGHFPYIEKPNEFKRAVNDFINTLKDTN
ncbi:MAG: hypothetical protein COA94_07565 [Rickettsiales bacterium]|nr:MAG: hypothetical protein COA94_07565 [Rickettsiales bacterium]